MWQGWGSNANWAVSRGSRGGEDSNHPNQRMERIGIMGLMGLLALALMVGWVPMDLVVAQQPPPTTSSPNATACIATLTVLLPCMSYLTQGNTSPPGPDCCSPLTSVLASNASASCFCLINEQASVSVNLTRARELTTLCNATVPDFVTACLDSSVAQAPSANPPTPQGPPESYNPRGSPPTTSEQGMNLRVSTSPFSMLLVSLCILGVPILFAL